MNVLFVTSWFPGKHNWKDGNFVGEHALAIVASGHQVIVVHERFSNKYLFPKISQSSYEGLTTIQIKLPRWLFGQLWFRNHWARQALKQIKEIGFIPEIVHGHVLIPVAPTAACIASKLKLPLVFTEHYTGFIKEERSPHDVKMLALSRSAIDRIELIMPVSISLAKGLKNWGVNRPMKVVYNTMNTSVFNFQPHHSTEPFIFLHISNFKKGMKNVDGIMRAFSAFQEGHSTNSAKLIIAGDGDKADLVLYRERHIPKDRNIEIHGSLAYAEVANLMQTSHCFVLFSEFETFSCVTAEALLCGMPVIATDIGPMSERIDTSNGILIPAGDEVALTEAMSKIRDTWSNYNRRDIAERSSLKYSYQAIASQFLDIYRSVIEK